MPAECILLAGMPEPGDLLKSTAFSHLFVLLQQGMATPGAVPDAERIKLAQLCCLMVATCRHAQARDLRVRPAPAGGCQQPPLPGAILGAVTARGSATGRGGLWWKSKAHMARHSCGG